MKNKLLLVVVGLSTLALTGCGQQTNTVNTIKVGMIAPVSGPASTYGEDGVNAAKMAVEKYNASHPNLQIELIVEDGKCNGADATSAAQKLINVDKVPVMLGGGCSSEAIAAGKIAQANNMVSVVSYPQSPNISKIGDHVFRYANGLQGGEILANTVDKHANHVFIISEKTEYAQAIASVAKGILGSKVTNEISFDSTEKDFSIIATRVKAETANTDVIVLLTQSEASTSNLIKAFDKEGVQKDFKGKIVGYPFFSSKAFINNVGPTLATNLYNVSFGPDTSKYPEAKDTIDAFNAKYTLRSMQLVPLLVTEAVNTIGDAIAKGAKNTEDFYKYFSALTQSSPRTGLFGSYYFSGSDAIGVPYFLEKVDNGVAKVVKDFE